MSKYCLVRLVGQEVKTSPSHGEISGSIPLRAVKNNTGNSVLFFSLFSGNYSDFQIDTGYFFFLNLFYISQTTYLLHLYQFQ